MICVSVTEKDVNKCMELISGAAMAEIRLDLTRYGEEEIKRVFGNAGIPLIATCRPVYQEEKRMSLLKYAIDCGAAFIDVETESDDSYIKELVDYAREKKCSVIVSYHNFDFTPAKEDLEEIKEKCFLQGADIAKIATMVNSARDNAKLLSLYDDNRKVVALGMGEQGKITRIAATFMGAPFTFAAISPETASAPGQLTMDVMNEIYNLMKL